MKKKFIQFEKYQKCYAKAWFATRFWKVRVQEDLPCGPQFLGHREESEGLPVAKSSLLKEDQKKTSLGRSESSQGKHWHRNDEEGVLETRLLRIHLGRRGLTGASYITTGSVLPMSFP